MIVRQLLKVAVLLTISLSPLACASATQRPISAPFLRLSAVAISVPDLDAAVAWYRDTLGLELGRRLEFPDLGLRLAWVGSEAFSLELIEARGSRGRSSVLPDASNPALLQGFGKIGFLVENVDAWEARLRAKSVAFQVQVRDDEATRSRTFVILDNNGNWLQFSQRPAPPP